MVSGIALLVLVLVLGGGAWLYGRNLNSRLGRTDPFAGIAKGRPAKTVDGAINMLLLGSDSRDPDNKAKGGSARTDTIMLLHVPANHQKVYLISIPRDLYVYIPQSQLNPEYGNTREKVNAAFAWGGLPLMVQTVEGFTGVRIDHLALIDFGGFQEVVDALGGVDMNIEPAAGGGPVKSIHKPFRTFRPGMNHLNGAEALDYVRQRYQFAEGDFARMRHQQQFLKAIMSKASSSGTLSNPFKLTSFLDAVTKAVTADNDFSLTGTALQFRNIRSSDLTFLTSPNTGSATVGGESVVLSDKTRALSLYQAVSKDTMADWVAKNPTSVR